MAQLFANAARSTLTASITSSSTQLQINPADQALFPVATGADWFKVALEDSSGNLEYMRVQRAVGQSLLTITERATEDATKFPARAFVAGSLVELRMTAADLASSIAHPSVGTGAHAATAISVTPAGGISAATVQAALQELDTEKANAADVTTALDGKASTGSNTFTGAQTLHGNAVDDMHAVPKQQAESIAASAVASRMQYSLTAAQSTASGSAVDFTSIPSWAKRLTISFSSVSLSGSDLLVTLLGTSAGYVTSGYLGSYQLQTIASPSNSVGGNFGVNFALSANTTAVDVRHGIATLVHMGGNLWAISGTSGLGGGGGSNTTYFAGSVQLPGVLDRVRFASNGSSTFDGGSVSLLVEG